MKNLYLIALLFLLSASVVATAQDKQVKMHQVVMQLNTADTAVWSSMLGNIRNFQKVWPGNVKIEVYIVVNRLERFYWPRNNRYLSHLSTSERCNPIQFIDVSVYFFVCHAK